VRILVEFKFQSCLITWSLLTFISIGLPLVWSLWSLRIQETLKPSPCRGCSPGKGISTPVCPLSNLPNEPNLTELQDKWQPSLQRVLWVCIKWCLIALCTCRSVVHFRVHG
jgi:hypothetical protein